MNAKLESALLRFHALDLLATPVAVLNAQGLLIFSNAALEDVIGQSRRSLEGLSFDDYFADPLPLQHALMNLAPCATTLYCAAPTCKTHCLCM